MFYLSHAMLDKTYLQDEGIIICPRSQSMANLPLAIMTEGTKEAIQGLIEKNHLVPVTSTIAKCSILAGDFNT